MKRSYIAKRFQSSGAGLSLDTEALAKYKDIIDLSIGDTDFTTDESIINAAFRDARAGHTHYGDPKGDPELIDAVCRAWEEDFGQRLLRDHVLVSASSCLGMALVMLAILDPGDEVIVIAPYFPEYRVWIETCGCTCVEVMADAATFQVDADAVSAAITEHTAAVIIDSPNNPTGAVYTRETLEKLADVLEARGEELGHPIYLISDEPYREITYGAEVPWVPAIYARTIVCYSYSKSLSLPGERIGWVLVPPTNPEHDRLVLTVAGAGRTLGFVCAPAIFQRVVIDCVDEPSDVAAYAENRRVLTEGLADAGYEFVKPDGAFYLWVKALEPDAEAFFERAKAHELLPVPSDSFGCPGWLRVSYCVSHDLIVNSLPAWKALAAEYK